MSNNNNIENNNDNKLNNTGISSFSTSQLILELFKRFGLFIKLIILTIVKGIKIASIAFAKFSVVTAKFIAKYTVIIAKAVAKGIKIASIAFAKFSVKAAKFIAKYTVIIAKAIAKGIKFASIAFAKFSVKAAKFIAKYTVIIVKAVAKGIKIASIAFAKFSVKAAKFIAKYTVIIVKAIAKGIKIASIAFAKFSVKAAKFIAKYTAIIVKAVAKGIKIASIAFAKFSVKAAKFIAKYTVIIVKAVAKGIKIASIAFAKFSVKAAKFIAKYTVIIVKAIAKGIKQLFLLIFAGLKQLAKAIAKFTAFSKIKIAQAIAVSKGKSAIRKEKRLEKNAQLAVIKAQKAQDRQIKNAQLAQQKAITQAQKQEQKAITQAQKQEQKAIAQAQKQEQKAIAQAQKQEQKKQLEQIKEQNKQHKLTQEAQKLQTQDSEQQNLQTAEKTNEQSAYTFTQDYTQKPAEKSSNIYFENIQNLLPKTTVKKAVNTKHSNYLKVAAFGFSSIAFIAILSAVITMQISASSPVGQVNYQNRTLIADKSSTSTTVVKPEFEELQQSLLPQETWALYMVGPNHSIAQNFEYDVNMVLGPSTSPASAQLIDERILEETTRMFEDAAAQGHYLYLRSGYRSYETQDYLFITMYQDYLAQGLSEDDALAATLKLRNVAGTSEHQTGLAIDLVPLDDTGADLVPELENEPELQWVAENCANYGFILRYESDTTHITGISYEPWHFRYVGVEHAQKITQLGITLEEYMGVA